MARGCLIVLLLLLNYAWAQNEPCNDKNHKPIDDPTRSASYVLKPGTRANCDKYLVMGWYRFMRGEMPTTKVDPNHCGTSAPIWMNGDLPKTVKTTEYKTACANYFGMTCYNSWRIKVRKCPGDFYVYYLKPTHGCPMAYCAGKSQLRSKAP